MFIDSYLAKYVRPCEISIHSNDHSEAIKYSDLQSCMSDVMLADTKQKCSELESVNACITHLHDSIEHYIIMCDVLWCLIRTNYSMTNLNCELVLRCTEIFDKMIEEIAYVSVSVEQRFQGVISPNSGDPCEPGNSINTHYLMFSNGIQIKQINSSLTFIPLRSVLRRTSMDQNVPLAFVLTGKYYYFS